MKSYLPPQSISDADNHETNVCLSGVWFFFHVIFFFFLTDRLFISNGTQRKSI